MAFFNVKVYNKERPDKNCTIKKRTDIAHCIPNYILIDGKGGIIMNEEELMGIVHEGALQQPYFNLNLSLPTAKSILSCLEGYTIAQAKEILEGCIKALDFTRIRVDF